MTAKSIQEKVMSYITVIVWVSITVSMLGVVENLSINDYINALFPNFETNVKSLLFDKLKLPPIQLARFLFSVVLGTIMILIYKYSIEKPEKEGLSSKKNLFIFSIFSGLLCYFVSSKLHIFYGYLLNDIFYIALISFGFYLIVNGNVMTVIWEEFKNLSFSMSMAIAIFILSFFALVGVYSAFVQIFCYAWAGFFFSLHTIKRPSLSGGPLIAVGVFFIFNFPVIVGLIFRQDVLLRMNDFITLASLGLVLFTSALKEKELKNTKEENKILVEEKKILEELVLKFNEANNNEDHTKAIQLYDEIIGVYEKNQKYKGLLEIAGMSYNNKGICLGKQKKYEEAIESFDHVIEKFSHQRSSQERVATALFNNEKPGFGDSSVQYID